MTRNSNAVSYISVNPTHCILAAFASRKDKSLSRTFVFDFSFLLFFLSSKLLFAFAFFVVFEVSGYPFYGYFLICVLGKDKNRWMLGRKVFYFYPLLFRFSVSAKFQLFLFMCYNKRCFGPSIAWNLSILLLLFISVESLPEPWMWASQPSLTLSTNIFDQF